MGDPTKDSRFSHIANDPRFKVIPRSQRQVKIDKRFQGMFKDKRFKIKYTVDKRGRPISRTSSEDLERYYALSSESSDEESDDESTLILDHSERKKKSLKKTMKPISSQDKKMKSFGNDRDLNGEEEQSDSESTDDNEETRSDDDHLTDKVKSKLHDMTVDYARGEGTIMSDSSSDEESSGDDVDDMVEHEWGELDKDAERTDEATSRLAICNMDWDRIRAVDLMVLLSSFTPPGGLVRSVTIYPSEFGIERMKKEEIEGPPELVQKTVKKQSEAKGDDNSDGDDGLESEEDEQGSSFRMEKLRQYQLNRLKYYYAVVECDSKTTANHIYTECDGMEYESSATRLDLRFIPDDTTFDQEPREQCSEMPDASKYRPRHFTTTALQQAKVELTWDETDPTRIEITNRLLAGDTLDDNDVRAYLASSSGEEESADEMEIKSKIAEKSNGESKMRNKTRAAEGTEDSSDSDGPDDAISKYRSLLSGIEEDEKDKKNRDVHMEISWGLGMQEKAEEAVKERLANSKERTPFQEMMEKRKQKRKEKQKMKLEQKKKNNEGDGNSDGNLCSDDDIPSDVDMNDPYFAEEFKDVKKSSKKKKNRKDKEGESEENQQEKAELDLLLFDKDDSKHFNFKKIQEETGNLSKRKRKAKQKKEREGVQSDTVTDNFEINVDDKRFSALFSSHHFNIDPTDPRFRKSQGMEALIAAKQKRLADVSQKVSDDVAGPSKKSKKDAELSLLVKSVKNKAQNLNKR